MCAPLAQLGEQLVYTQQVGGSSPSGRDPPTTIHPVALFGRAATKLEKVFYRDSKLAGAFYLTAAVVPPVVAIYWLEKRYPTATMTLALFSALGGTTLERIGERMARALEARDIDQARELVPWLCSRDPQYLDEQGIIRATVESLAENTSDAATAPILWATCGASGVVLHRLVNTLDAMVDSKERSEMLVDQLRRDLLARDLGLHLAIALNGAGKGIGVDINLAEHIKSEADLETFKNGSNPPLAQYLHGSRLHAHIDRAVLGGLLGQFLSADELARMHFVAADDRYTLDFAINADGYQLNGNPLSDDELADFMRDLFGAALGAEY